MASEWPFVPLESLVDPERPITYGVVKPGIEDPEGVLFVRGGDISDGRVTLNQLRTITEAVSKQYKRTLLRGGELLVSLVGNPGEVAIAPRSLKGANIARQVGMVCLSDIVEPRYVQYFLSSAVGKRALGAQSIGSVQAVINLRDLKRVELPLPNLDIQRQIAFTLGAIDDRIDNLRQTNATLEFIAQVLFKSWFVDFDPVRANAEGREPEGMDVATAALFPSEFEDSELGPIPKGWHVSTIGDETSVIDCLHAKKPELLDSGRPYLQLNCIREDGLVEVRSSAHISEADYAKWTSRIEAQAGDCVITNVGRVGAVAQMPTGFKAAIGRNMTAIRPNASFAPTFLIELLMSDSMRREIEHKTDAGTILSALNVKSIPGVRFVWPADELLVRFECMCRPMRAAREENLARASSLADLRDTLLPRLISGKLRLPEVEALADEVA
jgi:type I restriction enzyme S subunit